MKFLKNKIPLFSILIAAIFCSCTSSKYIQKVKSDAKMEFGITVTAPSQGIFFVENKSVDASKNEIDKHVNAANSIYNNFGPASDERFVGRTNARQLKFNVRDKTYLIDITQLRDRTAMVLFDGVHKPSIAFSPEKYHKLIAKIKKNSTYLKN